MQNAEQDPSYFSVIGSYTCCFLFRFWKALFIQASSLLINAAFAGDVMLNVVKAFSDADLLQAVNASGIAVLLDEFVAEACTLRICS